MYTMQTMNSLPNDQRGATLFVALILLVLISLIGVGTLKSAAIAEKMSANDYQKNITFQASESAVTVSRATTDGFLQIRRDPSKVATFEDVQLNLPNTTADVTFAAVSQAGGGLIEGISADQATGLRTMITSTGRMQGGGAASTTTVHGYIKLFPKASN